MPRRHAAVVIAACVSLAGGVPQIHVCHSGRIHVRERPVGARRKRPQRRKKTGPPKQSQRHAKRNKKQQRDENSGVDAAAGSTEHRAVSDAVAETPRTWLRVRDIADEIGVSDAAVRYWIRTGRLIARGGTPGMFLIHRNDFEAFIHSRERERERRSRGGNR